MYLYNLTLLKRRLLTEIAIPMSNFLLFPKTSPPPSPPSTQSIPPPFLFSAFLNTVAFLISHSSDSIGR